MDLVLKVSLFWGWGQVYLPRAGGAVEGWFRWHDGSIDIFDAGLDAPPPFMDLEWCALCPSPESSRLKHSSPSACQANGTSTDGSGRNSWPSARLADIVSCVVCRTHHRMSGIRRSQDRRDHGLCERLSDQEQHQSAHRLNTRVLQATTYLNLPKPTFL